jgi:hypothetical protein
MPVYNFNSANEQVSTIDSIPDPRSAVEQAFSPLALYNHEKPDIAYAERLAGELINLSGAPVKVFAREIKNDSEEIEVWEEDADPMYRNGQEIKAYIKPDTIAFELTRWGVDNPIKATIVFHRPSIISLFGARLIAPGDVIRVPYNAARALLAPEPRPYDFRILNSYDSGNFQYRWLYYTAKTQLLPGDVALKVRHA